MEKPDREAFQFNTHLHLMLCILTVIYSQIIIFLKVNIYETF